MSSEYPLAPRPEEPAELVPPAAAPPPEAPATNPLLALHSLLRGRYLLAACLAILGAAIGVPAGYFCQTLQYQSIGVIRMRPILPPILYQTEENGVMPMFGSFLASQVAQIRSRRVTGEAVLQPEWKALGRGLGPEAVAAFENSLTVENPRGTPLIQVSFLDRDPRAAATGVASVIRCYERLFDDLENEEGAPKIQVLEAKRDELAANLDAINKQILAIANDFGSSSLQQVYEFKLNELNRVESQLNQMDVQVALAPRSASPTTGPASQPAAIAANPPTARDPILQDLAHQKMMAERQIRVLEGRYGEHHPQVDEARTLAAAIEQDIASRTAELDALGAGSVLPVPQHGGDSARRTREQLMENQAILKQLYDKLKKETMELGQKNLQIEKLRADAQEVRERLEDFKTRIYKLTVEKNVGGRISVLSYGDVPTTPEKDRRIPLACVGGMGMAALGVGAVALIGYFDRRLRRIDTATSRIKRIDRLLGVLPDLPEGSTNAQQAAATAHCIHHVRAMLQIRQRNTGHKSFAITSPAPGDGKTSLTISLGMALASSGCRTLVVDCDVDGGGLTRKLACGAKKRLGQILLDRNALGESRLEEGLRHGRDRGIRLGAALVDLGHIPQVQIDEALLEQRKPLPGIGDVLRGAPVEEAILPTGYPLLSVLPLGSSPTAQKGKLSPAAVRKLFDDVCGQFDVVLVDTGPVLGSVEAVIVSAAADGVVLVVSRGGDRLAVENAVSLLASAGAGIEGVVFNRAEPADVAASVFSSSTSIRSGRQRAAGAAANPLEAAMAPAPDDSDNVQVQPGRETG